MILAVDQDKTSSGVPCCPGSPARPCATVTPRVPRHCPAQGSTAKGSIPAPRGTEAAPVLPAWQGTGQAWPTLLQGLPEPPGTQRRCRTRGCAGPAMQNTQPHPAGTGDSVERSQEDFSLESPITASCLWAPSPQHTTYSMKYECTEILTGTLLCYSSSQMEFMNCEIDFHFQECLNM